VARDFSVVGKQPESGKAAEVRESHSEGGEKEEGGRLGQAPNKHRNRDTTASRDDALPVAAGKRGGEGEKGTVGIRG